MNQIIKTKIDFFNEFIISIGIVENNYVVINETIFKKDFLRLILKKRQTFTRYLIKTIQKIQTEKQNQH